MQKRDLSVPVPGMAGFRGAASARAGRRHSRTARKRMAGLDFVEPFAALSRSEASSYAPPNCAGCVQRHGCLPEGLGLEQMRRLSSLLARSRTLAPHEYLFRTGDALDCLYVLKSGTVKLVSTGSNGVEQILGFCLPGELLGMEALGGTPCDYAAVAIETAAVCELPVAPLERLCREIPRLQHQLHLLFARQIVHSHTTLAAVGKGKAEAGIAALLLRLADRYKARGYSDKELNLCMSRTDIANYLGIAVETVSRMFSRFHRLGILKVDKRNIVILNADGLRNIAGENRSPSTSAGVPVS
jgi:CRP/FNR family transcriptional regulator, anaerobic regulatory protein